MTKDDTIISIEVAESAAAKKYQSAFNFESVFSYQSVVKNGDQYFPSTPYRSAEDDGWVSWLARWLLLLLVVCLTTVTFPLTWWKTVRRVLPWQRAVTFRLGRPLATRPPGFYCHLPWLDTDHMIDMRNRSILVPPLQFITGDGGVAELGAEVLYRVYDPHVFVNSSVDPVTLLRSLANHALNSLVIASEMTKLTRRSTEAETEMLEAINFSLKPRGMEATKVSFSSVKVHKEPDPLLPLHPLLGHLSAALGTSSSASSIVVAGQAPFKSAVAPLFTEDEPVATTVVPSAAKPAPSILLSATGRLLEGALARARPADDALAHGVYRLHVNQPDALFSVLIDAEGCCLLEGETDCAAVTSPCDVVVCVSDADLRALMDGGLSAVTAYATGRLTVRGNIHLLTELGSLMAQSANE